MLNWVIGLLLACHIGLISVIFWLDSGFHWLALLLLLCSASGLALLTGIALWRLKRAESPNRHVALISWIDHIDVVSDELPALETSLEDKETHLATAIQRLLARLHEYRGKLLIRHQRVQRLLRNVTDVLYHTDQDGCLTWITDSVSDTLGYTAEELQGHSLSCLLADPDTDLPILTQHTSVVRYPTRVLRRDGSIAWLLISARRIDDAEGHIIGSEGICRDGTRLIETQHQLDREKKRAQITLAAIGDGVITTDADGRIDYVNPRGRHMLSRTLQQLRDQPFENICRLYDVDRKAFIDYLVTDCLKTGSSREWSKALALVGDRATAPQNSNDYRSVTVIVSAIRDEQSRISGAVIVLHDVTRLERASRELTYQANHDALTGLLNRRAFEQRLQHIFESTRHNTIQHTLCYLDLDQFKLVNDSCGHNAGDAMLRQLSSQMVAQLRPHDTLARLGGDEFGILFEGTDLGTAQLAAERLRQWLEGFRFEWEGKIFRLGASFGLSLLDETSISTAELLRRADTACYLAKEQGRNQICIYHRNSNEARMRTHEVERMQRINEALSEQDFVLHAQPIMPLAANQRDNGLAIELLLRMKSDPNLISPQDILMTAERYSMASRIDRWVISHALQLIGQHQDKSLNIAYYSINISGQSITDEHFVGFARESIELSGVDPTRLVFEITETAAVGNLQRAADLMYSLRAIGCRFALDDFGTGMSSISYLKHLPSDLVKIDGKLVRYVIEDPVERSIIEALCRVSQSIGQHTVAEQVETKAQLDILKQIGVDYVQGYYIARPLPFEQFIAQLKNGTWRPPCGQTIPLRSSNEQRL